MSRHVVVFESDSITPDEGRRVVQCVRERFPGSRIVVTGGSGPGDLMLDGFDDVEMLAVGARPDADTDGAVLVVATGAPVHDGALALYPRPHFVVRTGPDVTPRVVRIDDLDYEHRNLHIWNRLSSHFDKGHVYSPFGYYYRMTGMGPLDAFGFRISESVESLVDRDSSHKVIAVFGGSTTWSIKCLYSEMFTTRLQAWLNGDAIARDTGMQFTCLNFGVVSSTVINEMMIHLLHASRYRPDLVVAHDGYNDLLYGSYSDPYLLKEWQLTYQSELESLGQLIHGRSDAETVETGPRPYQPVSVPDDVVAAYVARKVQFEQIVHASGVPFVWGFQPLITHKSELSIEEDEFVRRLRSDASDDWRDVRRGVHGLMASAAALVKDVRTDVVDFASVFRDASPDTRHFADTCHLTPAGDALVAEAYGAWISAAAVLEGVGR